MNEAALLQATQDLDRTRGLLWLPFLQRLTTLSPSSVVWKNASSALEGHGDLDVVAPPTDWNCIEAEFHRWAHAELLHPVAVCRHVPGSIFLLALDPTRPAFFEVDIKSRGTIRGTTIFRTRRLQPLCEMDPRGFRRLRPGAEGLLKLMMNCIGDDGELQRNRLNREHVIELLRTDPAGVRATAALFRSERAQVLRLATGLAGGAWSPRSMRLVRARLRLRLILEPTSVVQRVRMRLRQMRVDRSAYCPGMKTLIKERRLVPADPAGVQRIVQAHAQSGEEGSA